jgi:hypothetical protein
MMPTSHPSILPPRDIPMLPTRVADANAIPAAARQTDGIYEYIVAQTAGRPI